MERTELYPVGQGHDGGTISRQYIDRLERVRRERDTATFALGYLLKFWNRPSVMDAVAETQDDLSLEWCRRTMNNIEITYFVRLTAELEGILKDHLRTNHSTLAVQAKPKVDDLIIKIVRADSLRINRNLRSKLDEVRDYRNSIAHRGQGVTPVTFDEALARYTTFVSKLPDPY